MSESGSFETEEGYLEEGPSPKRVRYEEPEIEDAETEIVQEDEDGVVHIAVPQTQFEIEINSGQEGGSPEQIAQIQPAFGIIQEPEELAALDSTAIKSGVEPHGSPPDGSVEDSNTLNAIGRALIQMQQQQGVGVSQGITSGQLIITSPQASGPESGQTATPLYVMIPPSSSAEILQAMQGQSRPIAPKLSATATPGDESSRHNREAQRKATHNEVERRRRDRINELIKTLAQIVPGCQKKDAATGNIVGYVYSKGTVLDKTVEYLKELLAQNEQLAGTAKLAEKSANALSLLQNQITVLEKENAFLRAQIIQLGIDAANNAASSQQSGAHRQLFSNSLAQSLLNTASIGSQVQASPSTQPPASVTQNAAQQLLLSLAQSLTNNPLLSTLAQNPNASLTPTQLAATSLSASPSRLSTPLPSSQLSPQMSSGASPLSSAFGQATPLLNSLVQTLASITNTTTTTQANPLPKVSLPNIQSQGNAGNATLAAATASLLNTLLMAQLSGTAGGAQGSSLGDSSHLGTSVLNPVGIENVAGEQGAQ